MTVQKTRSSLAALMLALVLTPMAASAADLSAIKGEWLGTLDRRGRPVPVMLKINPAAAGAPAGELEFGEPDGCRNPITFNGGTGDNFTFTLEPSNGGRCEAYSLGRMSLTVMADGDLSLAVTQADHKPGPAATLSLATKAPVSKAVIGKWSGSYVGRGSVVPLTLALNSVRPGQPSGTLIFAGDDDCSNPLEFSGMLGDGSYVFTPFASDGGRCELDVFGTLTVRPGADGVTATLVQRNGVKRFDAVLSGAK